MLNTETLRILQREERTGLRIPDEKYNLGLEEDIDKESIIIS